MKIESIRVQGFRSLGDLTFNPGAFTVLVGPNNAGKSNVVDALAFLSDIYGRGVNHAIDVRGGFENIAFREDGLPRREMSFETVVSANLEEIRPQLPTMPSPYDLDDPRWFQRDQLIRLQHSFTLHGTGEPLISEFNVSEEAIRIELLHDDARSLVLRVSRNETDTDIELSPTKPYRRLALPFFDDERILDRIARIEGQTRDLIVRRLRDLSPLLWPFLEFLGDIGIYQLMPSASRAPSPPAAAAELGIQGTNLAALVQNLQVQAPDAWGDILESMTSMMPEIEEIEVRQTTDKLWTLNFRESGVGRRWTADEVSDGTIRGLAMFATIYDPHKPFLAIEEPENSLHPWVLRDFVSACRKISSANEPRQVVLTTHSPVLIDRLHPAEIAVVWRSQGQTHLAPLLDLEPGIQSSWEDGSTKLSTLLGSGLLLQAVPVP